MIEPRRALVRPRITSDGGDSLLLEDEITDRLAAGEFGLVALTGAAHSGKLTALEHLAAVFADDPRVVIVERLADFSYEERARRSRSAPGLLVVYLAAESALLNNICRPLRLAPWGEDEWIEYLLAAHREQCASVVARLRSDRARSILGGCTLLHRLVLDALAADESLPDAMAALRSETLRRLDSALPAVSRRMFDQLTDLRYDAQLPPIQVESRELSALLDVLHVRCLLAVEYILDRLRRAITIKVLRRPLPRALVEAVAARLRDEPVLLNRVRTAAGQSQSLAQPMGASLIHAAGDAWRPADNSRLNLKRAHLSDVRWSGIRLENLYVEHADLSGADFSEAQLSGVVAEQTIFRNAELHGAKLVDFYARTADFSGANLSDVRGITCVFARSSLMNADLQGASLRDAVFDGCDLRGASLRRADLMSAGFRHARIEGADFTGADLSFADLRKLDLRAAEFAGANFYGARLEKADLQGMRLPGVQFPGAMLTGADLTASEMPYANFSGADLRLAGLAEVEWENASLRDADLRGATFHMGSSRSGLCANPPASEGTRTGFYTDDYEEQGFKSPEEIRKANLCGADLRGAKLDDVDFYLVDLRGALYTPDQELIFRRSGAILESRV